ncbi:MAG: DUF3365 domain-containing protein [candidate division Zixibacteria bacterium]|nr:DUF3365 domain-containing protein [candidate division Zixibacteria bacterium]
MKNCILIIIVILLLAGCGTKDDAVPNTQVNQNSDDKLCLEASEKLIANMMDELKGQLMKAMTEDGAVNAINVCQTEAPIIAGKYSNEFITIKRVSDKNRNPENKADSSQLEILTKFAATPPPDMLTEQTWTKDSDTSKVFNYYKAIKTNQLCLKCHGALEQLEPDLKDTLTKLYPDDKAIGYEVGQLRGMFVVTIKFPEAKAALEELVAEK